MATQRNLSKTFGDTEKLIEHRKAFYSKNSEFSIYTTTQAADVKLRFSNPVFCKMMTGKKTMQLPDASPFTFMPDESLLVPPSTLMNINFPEAKTDKPTKCICIELEIEMIDKIIEKLNDNKSTSLASGEWRFHQTKYSHLKKQQAITHMVNKLADVFMNENTIFRDSLIELTMSELIIRVLQSQARELLIENSSEHITVSGLATIIQHIKDNPCEQFCMENLSNIGYMSTASLYRNFKVELGMSPSSYINHVKINKACELLKEPNWSVTRVCYELGYSNVSHFANRFKKLIGVTPKKYQQDTMQTKSNNILIN